MRRLPYYGVYHAEVDPALAATLGNVCVTARWHDPRPLVAAGLRPVWQVEQPTEALLRDPERAPQWPAVRASAETWQAAGVTPLALWMGDELWHNLHGGYFDDHPDWPSLRGRRGSVSRSMALDFRAGLDRYAAALKRLWPGVPLGSVDNRWSWSEFGGYFAPHPRLWDFVALDVYHTGPSWEGVTRDAVEAKLIPAYHEARRSTGLPIVGVAQAFGDGGWPNPLPPPEVLTWQAEIISAQPGVVALVWYGLAFPWTRSTTAARGYKRGLADDPATLAVVQAAYSANHRNRPQDAQAT